MIENEKQYEITKSQLGKFRDSVKFNKNLRSSVGDPRLHTIELDALLSECDVLEQEILDYELSKSKLTNGE